MITGGSAATAKAVLLSTWLAQQRSRRTLERTSASSKREELARVWAVRATARVILRADSWASATTQASSASATSSADRLSSQSLAGSILGCNGVEVWSAIDVAEWPVSTHRGYVGSRRNHALVGARRCLRSAYDRTSLRRSPTKRATCSGDSDSRRPFHSINCASTRRVRLASTAAACSTASSPAKPLEPIRLKARCSAASGSPARATGSNKSNAPKAS